MLVLGRVPVLSRVPSLGRDEQFAAATHIRTYQVNSGLDPEDFPVAFLGRVADLLHLHPADLICDEPPAATQISDVRLAEAALARAPRTVDELARYLGFSETRVQQALRMLPARLRLEGLWALAERSDERIALVATETPEDDTVAAGAAAGQQVADLLAPDVLDAAAIMPLLHTHVHGSGTAARAGTKRLTLAEAHLLKRRALAVAGVDGSDGAAPLVPHPDLLYALGLADRPGECPPPTATDTATTQPASDPGNGIPADDTAPDRARG